MLIPVIPLPEKFQKECSLSFTNILERKFAECLPKDVS